MKKITQFFMHRSLTTNQLLFWVSCYIALVLNSPFLLRTIKAILVVDNYSVLFLISLPIFFTAIIILLQGIFTFSWLTKTVLIFTLVCSSIIFYVTVTYGIVFDYDMIQNTVETGSTEALSYVNLYAILFFLLFGIIPSLVIYRIKIIQKPIFKELLSRLKLLGLSFVILVLTAMLFYSNYASVGRNNRELIDYITPYKMFDSSYKYVRNQYFYPPLAFKIIDTTPSIVRTSDKKHLTVLVLGETARAQNFSLNGYAKQTNSYTNKQGVISFSNMHSCGTATAVSVPCMFSRLNQDNYDKRIATAQQNALDLIHLAGADVIWISNNNGSCKGVCTRIQNHKISTAKTNPLCDGEYCFDEVLLAPLKTKIHQLTHNNTLIVLHMIGSHGPTYFKRYPKDKRIFTPDCQTSDIQHCSQAQLINTYDNTIAYTDFVLAKIIDELMQLTLQNNIETSMLYISDHGESLGENGVYLHGLPYAFAPAEQTHIPMIFWADSRQTDLNLNCLNKLSNNQFTHDNVFDILLDIMSVRTPVYDINNDPLIRCKSKKNQANLMLSSHKKILY